MKYILGICIVALALSGSLATGARAQSAVQPPPPEVTSALAAFDKAFREGDGDAVGSFLAEDLISTGPTGRVGNKKQYLDEYLPMAQQLAQKQISFDTFARSNIQSRVYGKIVVLAGALDAHTHITGVPAGDIEPVHYRFTQVWTQTPSGWKLTVMQTSLISKAAASSQSLP